MTEDQKIQEIISKYKPNCEYPAYYHESDIEMMMQEYAKTIAIPFAEHCANYGEKGPQGAWSEHTWQGNILAGEPGLTTEELYQSFTTQPANQQP